MQGMTHTRTGWTWPEWSARKLAFALAAGAMTTAAPAAWAQFDGGGDGQAATDTGSIGSAVLSTPRYMGADEHRLRALPFLSYRWANGWFIDGINGLGYAWSAAPGRRLGVHVGLSPEREEDDSAALRGMGNVDREAEWGGFVQQQLGKLWGGGLSIRSAVRYGAGKDNNGALAELGLGWGTRIAERSLVSAGLSANWVNQDYMQTYFGVTLAQSASSIYPEYTVSGGLRDVRASLTFIQILSPTTTGMLMLGQTYWQGEAADSPLVRDRRNTMAMVALMYRF